MSKWQAFSVNRVGRKIGKNSEKIGMMCEQWKDSNTQIKWKKMRKYIWIDLVHICICLNINAILISRICGWFLDCMQPYMIYVHISFQFFLKFSLFFFPFYSLQKPITLTWHSWFCFHLSAQVDIHINIWVDISNWVDIIM